MGIFAPETEVEIVAFAQTPAIALEIAAKKQLRRVGANGAFLDLLRTHQKFDFLGDDHFLAPANFAADMACHRASVAAGADNEGG